MPRQNTGGKSLRYDVAVSPELHKAVQREMKKRKLTNTSEAVREALAVWCGDAELAVEMKRGRRWPEKSKK